MFTCFAGIHVDEFYCVIVWDRLGAVLT